MLQAEPAWSKEPFTSSNPLFRAVRKGIESKYGVPPLDACAPAVDADAAIGRYKKSKKPVDGFEAVYTVLASLHDRQFPTDVAEPWDKLPSNDYEVTRLHFLWGFGFIGDELHPCGERLLKQDANDIEVLCALSYLYCHVGKKGVWNPGRGEELAKRALKVSGCPMTYLAVADAEAMLLQTTRDKRYGSQSVAYFRKFFAAAKKNDPRRGGAEKTYRVLVKQGY